MNLAAIARAERERRANTGRDRLAQHRITRAQLDDDAALWSAIVADAEAGWGVPDIEALPRLAAETRRVAAAALRKQASAPDTPGIDVRAGNLLALARHLAIRAQIWANDQTALPALDEMVIARGTEPPAQPALALEAA